MHLNDIIGHESVKKQIRSSIEANKLSHAHMFIGEDGVGKSIVAKEIAKLILKSDKEDIVDLYGFRVQKNKKSIGVDDVRTLITEINKKPFEGDKKVIIIYEGEKMTDEAQNAFLKTIEEPPKGVSIFILCENSENILETIKSRCQIYKFSRLKEEEIELFIKSKFQNLSTEEFKSVLAFSDGIPGRAERFLKDDLLKELRNKILDMLLNIKNVEDAKNILKYEEILIKYKDEWKEALTLILSFIRDILVYKETGNEDIIINLDKINTLKTITEIFSYNQLNDIINIIIDTKRKLESNVNTALAFDAMLIKIQEV